jgi:apolipoprotein N-acyltransferase
VTNEGVYDGILFKKHRLPQDRLHAVETGLWVVRATEISPSGGIAPREHPAFFFPEGERRSQLAPLPYEKGRVPYVPLICALTRGGR